eukprot:754939-Hanusia_phi.AAC.3
MSVLKAREALVKASAKGEIFSSIATTAPNGVQSASFSDAMELDDGEGISEAVKVKMTEMSTILSKSRKKREVSCMSLYLAHWKLSDSLTSANLNSEEQISRYIQKKAFPVHMANAILCLDLHPSRENLTVTGGADNKKSEQAIHKIAAHSKKVTRVQFHPTQELLFSTSSDKTVKVWSTASGDNVYTFKDHRGEVTGVTLHATGDYIVSASHDKTWALHDLALGKCRKVVSDPSVTCGYSAASFHPDGLILGQSSFLYFKLIDLVAGTATVDKLVRVWDVKTQQNVVTFSAHPGEVNCINFSENGYYVCTAGGDGFKMWDLRKVAKMSGQAVPVKHFSGDGEGNDAVFDYSGLYLACAGATSLEVYHTKSLNQVLSLPKAHSKSLTGVRFGPDAQFIVTASKDRELKFFSS